MRKLDNGCYEEKEDVDEIENLTTSIVSAIGRLKEEEEEE